jgi:hypothetical protein
MRGSGIKGTLDDAQLPLLGKVNLPKLCCHLLFIIVVNNTVLHN